LGCHDAPERNGTLGSDCLSQEKGVASSSAPKIFDALAFLEEKFLLRTLRTDQNKAIIRGLREARGSVFSCRRRRSSPPHLSCAVPIHSARTDSRYLKLVPYVITSFLNGEVTVAPQPSRFISSVPSKNVAARVRLKVPRRNKHDVSDTNPNSSLKFSADSTQAFMPILTLHDHSVKTKQFHCYTQHVSAGGQLNPP